MGHQEVQLFQEAVQAAGALVYLQATIVRPISPLQGLLASVSPAVQAGGVLRAQLLLAVSALEEPEPRILQQTPTAP